MGLSPAGVQQSKEQTCKHTDMHMLKTRLDSHQRTLFKSRKFSNLSSLQLLQHTSMPRHTGGDRQTLCKAAQQTAIAPAEPQFRKCHVPRITAPLSLRPKYKGSRPLTSTWDVVWPLLQHKGL